MNYRVDSRREPVKQLRLRPGGLQAKYPSSLRPSPFRAWCWETVLATETALRSSAGWLRGLVHLARQRAHEALVRLKLGEKARTCGAKLRKWSVRGLIMLRHGLVRLGRIGLELVRRGIGATVIWLRSRWRNALDANESGSAGRTTPFMVHSMMLRPLNQSPRPEQAFRRELARSHAQLLEQLRIEEEELARVATRVAGLQGLVQAQEELLVEMTQSDERALDRNRSAETSIDHLIAAGRTASQEQLSDLSLFQRN